MSANHQGNTKQLALRLAAIDRINRDMLLAELPLSKQEELRTLIHELEPFQAEFSTFELAMAEFEMEAVLKQRLFSESNLQQLLVNEPFAIKQQIIEVLLRNCKQRMTPHVQALIVGYLQKKLSVLPDDATAVKPAKSWWKMWS